MAGALEELPQLALSGIRAGGEVMCICSSITVPQPSKCWVRMCHKFKLVVVQWNQQAHAMAF